MPRQEGQFIRTRKPLGAEDPRALDAAAIGGLTLLSWPEVTSRGLLEQVRQLQFDTFLEHFGNMSKTPEVWQQHIESRSFAPDFSVAAVTDSDEVVGYVLGLHLHRRCRCVRRAQRPHRLHRGAPPISAQRGIGEFLLKKIWLAALRRGFTVASLGTDINNRSNAHVLYRRLGYVAVEQQFAYRIDAEVRAK